MKNKQLLPFINKPGRYLGHEYNAVIKPWSETALHCALIFPDLYEIGMSHQGLQILYHLLNGQSNFLAERCYCPDIDLETLLKEKNLPLVSLESGHELCDFDILGITLPYELCYTNILTILHLAGIPFAAADRDEHYPLIVGGGSCSLNPEPVADLFDAILLGDGEEAIIEIAEVVLQAKQTQLPRKNLLLQLSQISGVYIPSFFNPQYDGKGRLVSILRLEERSPDVYRRVVPDINRTAHLKNPLVPNARIVHDRLGVEIARGCTRGCRFCQAGITYRPVRERTREEILDIVHSAIANSGFEELALLSLSTGDYSCLGELLPELMDIFAAGHVSVSLPSMRVGTLTQAMMDQIKRVRKTGFTIAPEAGSERLRQVINKGISEEDLLATCRDAFSLGWNIIKLYFMIGLPTETWEDVEAIATLARKTKQEGDNNGRGRRQITVSIGTFVPKPHTPFQWERQLNITESKERINRLKDLIPRKGCTLKWQDPQQSYLEGVFSRGDRRLAGLLETAWKGGARLDAWTDHFDLGIWQKAAVQCELDLDTYLRARDTGETLPWQHLHSGVDDRYLQRELENAHNLIYTPDCRYHECNQCGVCDFQTIQPIVYKSEVNAKNISPPKATGSTREGCREINMEESHFKYLVTYKRLGNICYLGHLEILQLIFRALRRANIQPNFSKGFNPSPKVSFSPALPVGIESLAEYFIMDLPILLSDLPRSIALLDSKLPEGLTILDICLHSGQIPQDTLNTYRILLPRNITETERNRLELFRNVDRFLINKTRKGKNREIDIRPLIRSIDNIGDDIVILQTESRAGVPGIKVIEAMRHIFGMDEALLLNSSIQKTSWSSLGNE
jgi:radical SAM family uncharacterized protein/radical SAM-linked protein